MEASSNQHSEPLEGSAETKQNAFDKRPWRAANLAWLLSLSQLWDGSGKRRKLLYGYTEMVGRTGNEMYEEMKSILSDPRHFEGVDNQAPILMEHRLNGVPFQLVYGDFWEVVKDRLRVSAPPLGVVCADTQSAIRPQWWDKHEKDIKDIVERGSRGCPQFALILNLSLGMGTGSQGLTRNEQMKIHADRLYRTFHGSGKWNMSDIRKGVEVLPAPLQAKDLPRWMGVFHLYRSKNIETHEDNVTPMVTVRMSFDRRNNQVTFNRGGVL